ncbi:serine protease inhibitor 42Dd isoform X2 [Drosophila tropicalis]|uniref:serine protease inhibitor 42Dd isoform X2 n=1 Tax=Drosophila tropicalis TaxID=46794 RepID=UPI0035AB9D9C
MYSKVKLTKMDKPWHLHACWLLVLLHLTSLPTEAQPQSNPKPNHNNNNKNMANEVEFSRRLAIFSINVYNQVSLLKPQENVVFSPFSIQTCAAMARLGAKKETAEELDRGLGLVSSDTKEIAESFHQVLATYEKSEILRIANKIFVMKGYTLREDFNKLLTEQFLSSAENLDFAQNTQAANTINQWAEQKTNHLIKNLIDPSVLSADSRLVLVNAIHFKGNWVHQFDAKATHPEPFYLNDVDSINVPMMNVKENFGYAELPELDATALHLPYKDSDLSMLIILPNSKTGLPQLEEKLRSTQLSEITKKLYQTKVVVKLPKFKAEFEMELTNVFQKLGMTRIFSDNANFSGMLESPEAMKVSAIIHKAFIEVNEQGTEAAAATAIVMNYITSIGIPPIPPEYFNADHPFIYYITNGKTIILFKGKMIKF